MPLRLLPLVVLLALCALCATTAAADAQLQLEQARAAIGRGDRDAAIAHLEQAVAQEGKLAAAHRWLSRLYADKGMREKALDAAAAAVLLDPDAADEEYLRRLLEGGLPKAMGRRTPEALPLRKVAIIIEPGEDRLAGRRGARQGLIIADESRAASAADPRFGWAFDRACHGYALNEESQRWDLALVVHYAASGGPGRAELAADCAGLLARIVCLREAYLGAQPASSRRPLHVWLAEGGEPGAESWGSNIYLCAAATARPPAEWARQVIHEYGHVALPGINHFTEPERWANGRLSEQLFARWLGDCAEGFKPPGGLSPARGVGARHALPVQPGESRDSPMLTPANLADLAADADRCITLFLQQGPASALIDDSSAAGMDYYLGFAGYVERAFGPRVLASAMRQAPGATCRAFVVGVQAALRREAQSRIELRTLPQAARNRGAQWVYLPAGRWMAACRGAATSIVFNGRTLGARETDIGRTAPGWHRVTAPPGTTVTFAPAG